MDGSLTFCVDYSMSKIHKNGFAPFRFLTPFPHCPSRRLRNSARWPSHLQADVCIKVASNRLILTCSNILSGRLICGLPQISGVPRGYIPLVAGQSAWDCPRRGGREPHGMRRPLEGGKRSCSPSKLHRLPSMADSGRLNLQGRIIHSCVFYPHYLEENHLDLTETKGRR